MKLDDSKSRYKGQVASLVEAWIETTISPLSGLMHKVASLVEAWIEIFMTRQGQRRDCSPLL